MGTSRRFRLCWRARRTSGQVCPSSCRIAKMTRGRAGLLFCTCEQAFACHLSLVSSTGCSREVSVVLAMRSRSHDFCASSSSILRRSTQFSNEGMTMMTIPVSPRLPFNHACIFQLFCIAVRPTWLLKFHWAGVEGPDQ